MIAAILRQTLRIVIENHEKIARLVGGRDRHERREHAIAGIVPMDQLVGGAGLAANEIASDIGELGRTLGGVDAHEIAQGFARFGAHDARAQRLGGVLVALEECWRQQRAAVHESRDGHHRLQGRDADALTKGDGDGVQLRPALGHQRLGALGQFGAQTVELTHLAQEGLVAIHAHHHRHARRADVR